MFSGVKDSNSRYDEIYERWFGRDSEIFYPLDRANRNYLEHRIHLGALKVPVGTDSQAPVAGAPPTKSTQAVRRRVPEHVRSGML